MERLNDFSRAMYADKYLLPNETLPDLIHRVVTANVADIDRVNRLKSAWEKCWWHPSTPVTSNSGTDRGMPISCFVGSVGDSKEGIFSSYYEDMYLSSAGGGIGKDWSAVREVGSKIGVVGESSGIVPFIKITDAMSNGISQGALRRGSQAVYLNVSHPEIEEFLEIRRPTGGDINRKCLNLHHGVVLSDEFMKAVLSDSSWDLISPKDGKVVNTVSAFDLFRRILITRLETGEPYIVYEGNANSHRTELYELANYFIKTSQLCVEIFLHTSEDKTNVCCLSSLNLEYYDEWKNDPYLIEDVLYFLDGVIDQFVEKISKQSEKAKNAYKKVLKAVLEERSIALGVMGQHSYFQKKNIPFESAIASSVNNEMFLHIKTLVDKANIKCAEEKGSCGLAERFGKKQRWALTMAIAPTASISILCGNTSGGIEPWLSNAYVHKNNIGTVEVRNKYLEKLILEYKDKLGKDKRWVDKQWKTIISDGGSVKQLDFLSDWERDVFKTAFEIDNLWIIEHASIRQKYIDQGQSVNLFLLPNISKQRLFDLHIIAWKKGLKGLYYCRSQALNRASVGKDVEREVIPEIEDPNACLSCQ